MTLAYDRYYQTENLFGDPYPELIQFFTNYPKRGNLLDLGCGQGRNAIALAKLGYQVTGIDSSKTGIHQMNLIAQNLDLSLKGLTEDIHSFTHLKEYDFVLLDSMFHFTPKDKTKEIDFIKKLIDEVHKDCLITFCIPNKKNIITTLKELVDSEVQMSYILEKDFDYIFKDSESNHQSTTPYKMLVVQKM